MPVPVQYGKIKLSFPQIAPYFVRARIYSGCADVMGVYVASHSLRVCALTFAQRGPIGRPSVDVVMAVVCIVRPFTLIARALFCRLDYMHSSGSLLRNGVCSSLKRVMISHQTRSQPTATRMKPGGVHELVVVVVHYAMLDGAGWAAVVVEGARPFPTPRTRSSTHSDQNKLLCNSFAFMCACVP